jgi:hypothetical protein
MKPRFKQSSGTTFAVIAFCTALALVVNPDIRAILLFIDAIGLELVVLLLLTQLRIMLASALPFSRLLLNKACRLVSLIGAASIRSFPSEEARRPLDVVWMVVLVVGSYGVLCGIQS